MDLILRGYYLNDPTWFYLSFLLSLAVYFKFSRFWSIRNLDLVLLLLVSPGLLLVRDHDESWAAFGFGWLFLITALLLVRTLSDGLITRRPRLEQNMNAAGMAFLCAATFLFLTTKLLTEQPSAVTVASVRRASELVKGTSAVAAANRTDASNAPAAGAAAVDRAAEGTVNTDSSNSSSSAAANLTDPDVVIARLIAIFAHLAVIVGLMMVGRHVFADPDVGFAMATLYMLLPCTAYDVGKTNHVLPAALIIWAVWAYRRPFLSGTLLGLACAMMFFPVFLLPLWAAFYGRRGAWRFGTAVGLTTASILSCLMLLSEDSEGVVRALLGYVPWQGPLKELLNSASQKGWWDGHEAAYVVPVFAAYVVMLVALTIWPHRKNLATVIPASAAIVIGTQFWYPRGGVYVLWYLPLLLLVVFRPMMANHFAPELEPLSLFRRAARQPAQQPELVGAGSSAPPAP
jgi:hypothetical protein